MCVLLGMLFFLRSSSGEMIINPPLACTAKKRQRQTSQTNELNEEKNRAARAAGIRVHFFDVVRQTTPYKIQV